MLIILGCLSMSLLLTILKSRVEVLFGLIWCVAFSIGFFNWDSSCEFSGIFYADVMSMTFCVLSFYISLLMILVSLTVTRFYFFKVVVLWINIILAIAFVVSSMLVFYLCFESVLVPTVFLILGWGYQPERVQAVSYMIIYTVLGSLPLIYGLVFIYSQGYSDGMGSISNNLDKCVFRFAWLYMLAFLIKLPVFPVHLWLPKAHVEAPVSGSMILAGLLLKLGGFGIVRLLNFLVLVMMSSPMSLILSVSLLGGFMTSLVCLRQTDLKCLIAYSSIGHMSFVLVGALINLNWSILGASVVMLGHGLCSSGLFVLANCMYCVSKSRLLCMNKGYLLIWPFSAILSFVLVINNAASPPSLNLFGEILIFVSVGSLSVVSLALLSFMSFMTACYSLFFYLSCQHGKTDKKSFNNESASFSMMLALISHVMPLNFLFLFIP